MDGTFLASDKQIPPRNLLLLDELLVRGVEFVPCTGRPVMAIPPEVMSHAATHYAIGANGAVVYDVVDCRNLHVEAIDKARVLALYERVRDLHVTFDVFADGEVYSERARYDAMVGYDINGPTLSMLLRVRKPTDLFVPELLDCVSNVEKITCFWHRQQDCDLLEAAIEEVGGFSSAHGDPKDVELQTQGVSKGSALAWLCDHVGVWGRDTVAFGDETNDIPLLEAAGTGVAMANAANEVLAIADRITTSNDEAGVAAYFGL